MPYLRTAGPWAYDVYLEVYLQSATMARPERICASNSKHLYWNICQQLAHHTSNGCNLRPGDLLASGTISGPTPAPDRPSATTRGNEVTGPPGITAPNTVALPRPDRSGTRMSSMRRFLLIGS